MSHVPPPSPPVSLPPSPGPPDDADGEVAVAILGDMLTDLVWTAAPDGRLLSCNQSWTRYTGLGFDTSTDSGWLQAVHPDDRASALMAWRRAVDSGDDFEDVHRLRRGRDGAFLWHVGRARPWRDGAGHVRKWIATCVPLADGEPREPRPDAANGSENPARVEASDELAAIVAGLKADLAAARDAEALAARRREEFLALLGHELRNPLAPITTALQLMKLKSDEQSLHERNVIERQVTHLARLLDDLLDVSRITRGKVTLRKEPLDLATIVARAVESMGPLIESRGHRLSVEVPRGTLSTEGDEVRLCQVVQSLLSNAARYTKPNGDIWVRGWRQGAELKLSVRDNGAGIDPGLLPSVFDMFVQGDRGTQREEGGLGVGLTIARKLVELHGGSISGRSEGPGQGSEFIVTLPISKSLPVHADVKPGPRTPSPTAIVRGRKVLIVDDNIDLATTLREVFVRAGHEVRVAHDGAGGLAITKYFRPEVAILDLGLPEMDGYELARRLRQELAPDVPRLIAMTGYGQESDMRRSRDAGFAQHLVKPVDVSVLKQIVLDA
jgi:signal transduction histidine kinase